MKTVLIPWSGGVDSTYLIYKNLEEGNKVKTFSVLLNNNIDQRDREKNARKVLSEYFVEKYPDRFIPSIEGELLVSSGINMVLCQPPIWILFSHYTADLYDVDEIQIAYVMNDDAISYLDDVKNLYNAYSPFRSNFRAKLEFPLIKMKKYQIMDALPEHLMKNISYCEGFYQILGSDKVVNKNCPCVSCERHKNELKMSRHYYLDINNKDIIEKKVEMNSNQLEFEFKYSEN